MLGVATQHAMTISQTSPGHSCWFGRQYDRLPPTTSSFQLSHNTHDSSGVHTVTSTHEGCCNAQRQWVVWGHDSSVNNTQSNICVLMLPAEVRNTWSSVPTVRLQTTTTHYQVHQTILESLHWTHNLIHTTSASYEYGVNTVVRDPSAMYVGIHSGASH